MNTKIRNIIDRIFPNPISNIYTGNKAALWVFILITAFTIIRSLIHMLATDGGAQSVASIPIDAFGEAARSIVILLFALWGSSQLLLGIVYIVVLCRYKSMIPLMYILIVIEYLMRIVLGHLKPIETISTPPGEIGNYILIPLALAMLFLSLKSPKK